MTIWPKILRSIWSNKSHLWDRSKKQVRVFFDFVDIIVLNSKSLYDKMESAVPISSLNFRFNLARSMIGKFWNRNRAVPTSRPSKRSKGESFVVVDYLPEFATTLSQCALCSFEKIENRTFISCTSCNVHLCLQKERNCFYNQHFNQWTLLETPNFNVILELLWRHSYSARFVVSFFIYLSYNTKKHCNNPI